MSVNSSDLIVRKPDSEDDSSSNLSASGILQNSTSSLNKIRDTFRRSQSSDLSNSPASSPTTSNKQFGKIRKPARDPASIERSNLVNICKLVVKELLNQSIQFGRQLDSDHLPLQHFFIVLEHVLRHGLRHKKGLLGPKKELWDLLQSVEKYCVEAQDVTASVRDLPTVRTHIGRARAWLRIALMQKKLADYMQAIIEHRDDSLIEYYEPHALMMSEEVVVIMGILVGLNVIDCNLCVKEEDLDSQQGVIDFSLYLRSSSRSSPDEEVNNVFESLEGNNMTAVLDQKNYIEELNRHLNATVTNLQAKVEGITTTNALMKEDLAIARNSLLALQAENQALRRNVNNGSNKLVTVQQSTDNSSYSELQNILIDEKKKNEELQKELKLQISLKAETDMAMKLLEKDIHEKQDTIISLRRQLDDIKQINLDMYRKLQEVQSSLNHKSELLNKLESQKDDLANTIALLETKWSTDKTSVGALQTSTKALSHQIEKYEERAAILETDLRIEREWRLSLQTKEIKLKEQINLLKSHIQQLTDEVKKCDRLESELDESCKNWSDAQVTLEELGIQLSISKLRVQELEDKVKGSETTSLNEATSTWVPDNSATACSLCQKEFRVMTRRKHHCRNCGGIFCNSCSEKTVTLPSSETSPVNQTKPVRVCDKCYENFFENCFED